MLLHWDKWDKNKELQHRATVSITVCIALRCDMQGILGLALSVLSHWKLLFNNVKPLSGIYGQIPCYFLLSLFFFSFYHCSAELIFIEMSYCAIIYWKLRCPKTEWGLPGCVQTSGLLKTSGAAVKWNLWQALASILGEPWCSQDRFLPEGTHVVAPCHKSGSPGGPVTSPRLSQHIPNAFFLHKPQTLEAFMLQDQIISHLVSPPQEMQNISR